MVKGCREYYMIDAIVDGNIIRKRKYCKISTMLTSMWYDYNNVKVEDPSEISRIEGLATPDNKVDASYDDYSVFMSGTNQVQSLSEIPMDKHCIVVDWTPLELENVLTMKYPKGIDGDSYYIVVKNVSTSTGSLYIPSDEEEEESRSTEELNVNIGGAYLSIAPDSTERVRVTYRDNKWYWEIYPKSSSAPIGSIDIGDVDYLVFRYLWESSSGKDLDTATEIENSNIPNVDGNGVGYNCPGNSIQAVTSILKWGGDNTGSGKECVWVSIKDLRENHLDVLPEETNFMAYATWFASKGDGKCSFEVKAYKGGEMSQDGYNFVNNGGETVFENVYDFVCDTYKGAPDYRSNYTKIIKTTYVKSTNSVYITIGGQNIGNDSQNKDIEKRVSSIEAKQSTFAKDIKESLFVEMDHKPTSSDISYVYNEDVLEFSLGAIVKYCDSVNNICYLFKLLDLQNGLASWGLIYQGVYSVLDENGFFAGNKKVVNIESGGKLNGILSDEDEITFVNISDSPVVITFNDISMSEYSSLRSRFNIQSMTLPIGASVSFYKTEEGYLMGGVSDSNIFPQFANRDRAYDGYLKVASNGLVYVSGQMMLVDEDVSSELDLLSLNTAYPNPEIGFVVICPSIQIKYEYVGQGRWISTSFILVS